METLTTKSFKSAISEGITFIDFFAQWCRPCINFAPTFERLSSEFASKAKFYKVDIDQDQQIAIDYGIRSIPTIVAFSNEIEIARKIGSMNEIDFRIWANSVLGNMS